MALTFKISLKKGDVVLFETPLDSESTWKGRVENIYRNRRDGSITVELMAHQIADRRLDKFFATKKEVHESYVHTLVKLGPARRRNPACNKNEVLV